MSGNQDKIEHGPRAIGAERAESTYDDKSEPVLLKSNHDNLALWATIKVFWKVR